MCSLAMDRVFFWGLAIRQIPFLFLRKDRFIFMYQALYRKWRPKTFDQVVGQRHITETLKNQVQTGRLSHAYLFIGTRGTGKTTCAKILAKAVNCENPQNGNPCCQCKSCLGIEDGSILDVVELDAASNNGVDNVRALREEAVFSPASVKKRVYIVDEVHMLSLSAFNALLKILEEPPEHLMFILATTELNKVPATILSRCQRHSFKRIDSATISSHLQYIAAQENLNLTPEAAALLSRLADGGMRDALSLLDQCAANPTIDTAAVLSAMGLAGSLDTAALLEDILSGSTGAALTRFQTLWQEGKDPAGLLGELESLLRDILMLQVAPNSATELLSGSYDDETLRRFRGALSGNALLRNISTIQSSLAAMRGSVNPKITAELCLVSLCEPELSPDFSALQVRVERLEQGLPSGAENTRPAQTPKTAARAPGKTPDSDAARPPWEEPEPTAAANGAPAKAASPAAPVKAADRPPWEEAPAAADSESPASPPVKQTKEAATAAPPSPAPAPSVEAGNWDTLVESLRGNNAALGIYNFLHSPGMAQGVFSGNVLTIYVKDSFTLELLKKPANQDLLRAAATRVCGQDMALRLNLGSPEAAPAEDKLDGLKKFGNVRFE